MLTLEELKMINELCFSPTNLKENETLIKIHLKAFDLDFDKWCSTCLDKAKKDLAKRAIEQLLSVIEIKQNGAAKN